MLHQIGVGALGPVFRTYEPERDRLVAVKLFRLDITPEQARALADELSRAADAGLFHPSIVEPIGAGVEGTLAYGAEEYVAAESLDVAMREYAPAPLATALPFITQLAGAIDFARAAGVGHGALHPRDIFVTPEEARATGFGIVEALERVGLRAPVRRPYSAPERIDGGPWSTRADVFSLAAIAFELLTGRRPAGLGSEIGPLTSGTPNGWTDALHAVLARGMDADPEKRYASALALASALEAAGRGESVEAVVVPAPFDAAARAEPPDPLPSFVDETAGLAAATVAVEEEPQPSGELPEPGVPASHDQDNDEAGVRLAAPEADAPADEEPEADAPADEEWTLRDEAGARARDADDIVRERDDDEAHHRLSAQEMDDGEGVREEADRRAPEDISVEAELGHFITEEDGAPVPAAVLADAFREHDAAQWRTPVSEDAMMPEEAPSRFAFEGADTPRSRLALASEGDGERETGPASRDDWYRSGGRASAADPFETDQQEAPPAAVYGHAPAEARSPWTVAAVLLVVGLLGGLAAGYLLWGRAASPAIEAGTPGAADPAAAGEPAPPADAAGQGQPAAGSPATPPGEAPAPTGGSDTAAAAPRAAAPAPRGRLIIRSTPSGAGVTVDGTWRGRTPLTLTELPLGQYEVRVVEPGYTVASQTVTLSARTPERTLSMRLEQPAAPGAQPAGRGTPAARGSTPAARGTKAPAATPAEPFVGSVYVDSRPRGAAVSINGKPVGVTPLRVPEMPIGTHVVRMELPDHRIWSSTARVTAGQEVRVTGSLEPIP